MADVGIWCDHFGRALVWPGECTICSGADERRANEQASAPRTFVAKFASQCAECNLPIAVGQLISWTTGLPAVHRECK